MSYGTAAALQVAVYRRLVGDAALGALVGTAIYDVVPAGPVPGTYVSLGPEDVRDRSDATGRGAEHRLVVSVVTDAAGFQTAKLAAGAVSDALFGAGLATGPLTNQSGAAVTVAGLTASTGFSTVNIQTTGMQLVDLDTGADLGLRPDLNFSGSGPISGTGFTATITSAGLAGSGEADGQFYGPNAEEIGGTYEMDGFVDPYQTLGGSFGGN